MNSYLPDCVVSIPSVESESSVETKSSVEAKPAVEAKPSVESDSSYSIEVPKVAEAKARQSARNTIRNCMILYW